MFRKPKRIAAKTTGGLRRKEDEEDDNRDRDTKRQGTEKSSRSSSSEEDDDDNDVRHIVKRSKTSLTTHNRSKDITTNNYKEEMKKTKKNSVLHHFETTTSTLPTAAELATRSAEYHGMPQDRRTHTNKLLAGPIRAQVNIRTTCRFDYQPDICKDYKDTGFCGFGDTCIYLHDRGDTMSGWQLEQQWEEQQKAKRIEQERQMTDFLERASRQAGIIDGDDDDHKNNNTQAQQQELLRITTKDGIPFACYLCRNEFNDPVVTNCGHYFCQSCIMKQVQENQDSKCPICSKETHSTFHQPTKLLTKKRKLVGTKASWKDYYQAFTKHQQQEEQDDDGGGGSGSAAII